MHSLSVALLEDEPSHATLMDYHLTKLGVKVNHYINNDVYMADLSLYKPNLLIISDQLYDTPITTFIHTLEEKNIPRVPILIMTTGRHEMVYSDIYEIHYLHKPFSIRDFRQAVEFILYEPTMR